MLKLAVILPFTLLLLACGEQVTTAESTTFSESQRQPSDDRIKLSEEAPAAAAFGQKEVGGVRYTIQLIPALDYLRKKGEQVAKNDVEALKKETVAILDIRLRDAQATILSAANLQLTRDEVAMYLSDQIARDVIIEQDGREFTPNAVRFDGLQGVTNRVKVFFFLGELHSNQPMKALVYDRMFGNGLIKFGINEQ